MVISKRIAVLTCASLLISVSLLGQKDTTTRPFPFHRHEISFGIGDPISYNQGVLPWREYGAGHFGWDLQRWFSNDEYVKRGFISPTVNINYLYRIKKWLWVGGGVTYVHDHHKVHDIVTDQHLRSVDQSTISILPNVRFSWLNRPYIMLYSGVSLGYLLTISDVTGEMIRFWHGASVQLTALGIYAGKKWFGFTEFGWGNRGIVTAGFGYRFNSIK